MSSLTTSNSEATNPENTASSSNPIIESQSHPYLGELLIPAIEGTFQIAYTPNIVNKTPVHRQRKLVNGQEKDVTYTENFITEWVNFDRLNEIVCGQGWSISRPFEGSKCDDTISNMSYIGLDFDDIDPDKFEEVKKHPFVKDRGFFHYSASHGSEGKHGISGHWICPIEYGVHIETAEQRKAWQLVLQQITYLLEDVDRKAKDLQRLFYGAKGRQAEVWGDGTISIEEIEYFYDTGKAAEAAQLRSREEANKNFRNRRSRTRYTYEDAVKLTREYVVPVLINGAFPDTAIPDSLAPGGTKIRDSYDTWLSYFVGWAEVLGPIKAAKLMDQFAPDRTMGSLNKINSFFKKEPVEGTHQWTFGSTMKLLKVWGYDPSGEVFGETKINADKVLNPGKRYLEMEDIETKHKCVIVKSPKGTGKTNLIEKLASSGQRILVLGHRRTLLGAITGRTGIPNYQDVVPREATNLCITIDSLHLIDLKRQHFDVIIIDEVEQVLQHCTGKTLADKRPLELKFFRWLIDKAGKIVCFDADISNVTINFFNRHVGKDEVFVVENKKKMGGKTIELYPSRATLSFAIKEDLKNGKKVAICTNSKRYALEHTKDIQNNFPQLSIKCITSDNSGDKETIEFIKGFSTGKDETAIDEVDVLIYSPSLGTGVSIDGARTEGARTEIEEPHFDTIYLLGVNGVTTHFDLDQLINRVRRTKTCVVRAYIYPDDKGNRKTDAESLKPEYFNHTGETASFVTIDTDGSLNINPGDLWYCELWLDVQCLRNQSMNHLRTNFVQLMRDQGHEVKYIGSDFDPNQLNERKEALSEARKSLKEEKIHGLMSAPSLTDHEYEVLKSNPTILSKQDKLSVEAYEIRKLYGDTHEPSIVHHLENKDYPEKVGWAEIVTGMVSAKEKDQFERSEAPDAPGTEGQAPMSRVLKPHQGNYSEVKNLFNEALREAGFGSLDGQGTNLVSYLEAQVVDNEMVGKFIGADILKENGYGEWLGKNRERIKKILGVELRSNFETDLVLAFGQIISVIGLKLEKICRKRDGQESRVQYYKIRSSSVELLQKILDRLNKDRNEPSKVPLEQFTPQGENRLHNNSPIVTLIYDYDPVTNEPKTIVCDIVADSVCLDLYDPCHSDQSELSQAA